MRTVRLRLRHDTFLQVLLREFELHRIDAGGLRLVVRLDDNLDAIHDSKARAGVHEANRRRGKHFRRVRTELSGFLGDANALGRRFDLGTVRFRYANAGVLPLVTLEGEGTGETTGLDETYACLFYRAIFPVGWNIANGASNLASDLLHPDDILLREFGEELVLCHPGARHRYVYPPSEEKAGSGTLPLALEAWGKDGPTRGIERWAATPLPIKLLDGPDEVRVDYGGRTFEASGFFLSVTPDDSAIEVDRVAVISLSEGASFLDGEYEGFPLDRPIGLFPLRSLLEGVEEPPRGGYRPARLFYSGEERDPDDLEKYLEESYFPRHEKHGFRTKAQHQHYARKRTKAARLALCPITRSILSRYGDWDVRSAAEPGPAPAAAAERKEERKDYDLFISYKSENEALAFQLYEYAKTRGHEPFCSGRSIPEVGESDYRREIDRALESARWLVVIATDAAYLHSGWLYYEWSCFLNELNSGRKEGSELVTLTEGIDASDLPLALRSRQSLTYEPASPGIAFQNVLRFLRSAKRRARD